MGNNSMHADFPVTTWSGTPLPPTSLPLSLPLPAELLACIVQAALVILVILLPQPAECWDYRPVAPGQRIYENWSGPENSTGPVLLSALVSGHLAKCLES